MFFQVGAGILLALGIIHFYFWYTQNTSREYLLYSLITAFSGVYYLTVTNFAEFGTIAVFSAAVFYGLFPWFAGYFTKHSNKSIQILFSLFFFAAFTWFTINPQSIWSEFANLVILCSLIYGIYLGFNMRKDGAKKDATYFLVLTIICTLLVVDEILLWSTAYRPHFGFMPLDLYPFVFSFLMNWKLINSFKYSQKEAKTAEEFPEETLMVEKDIPTLAEVERTHILEVLEKTSWKINGENGAAIILDIHPNTLRSRMKKLEISRL